MMENKVNESAILNGALNEALSLLKGHTENYNKVLNYIDLKLNESKKEYTRAKRAGSSVCVDIAKEDVEIYKLLKKKMQIIFKRG